MSMIRNNLASQKFCQQIENWVEEERVRLEHGRRKRFRRRVAAILVSLAAVTAIFALVVGFAGVVGSSMSPTLRAGDVGVYLRLHGAVEPGDIVVFHSGGQTLIKRVIAVAGDKVDVDAATGRITVNGQVLDEPYAVSGGHHKDTVDFPATVPEGALFVLGDNRDDSIDSRNVEVGMVPLKNLMGKVVTVLRTSF